MVDSGSDLLKLTIPGPADHSLILTILDFGIFVILIFLL